MKHDNLCSSIAGRVTFPLLIGLFVLSIMVAPFYLLIRFRDAATEIVLLSKGVIPWLTIILLCLLFHDDLQIMLRAFSQLIPRLKSGKVGLFEGQFGDQQSEVGGLTLNAEQVQQVRGYIQATEQEKATQQTWLRFYFHKCVGLQIFRSQVELLIALSQAPDGDAWESLRRFHQLAISRNPSLSGYPFEQYMQFLESNSLITVSNSRVQISDVGRGFLQFLQENRVLVEHFSN